MSKNLSIMTSDFISCGFKIEKGKRLDKMIQTLCVLNMNEQFFFLTFLKLSFSDDLKIPNDQCAALILWNGLKCIVPHLKADKGGSFIPRWISFTLIKGWSYKRGGTYTYTNWDHSNWIVRHSVENIVAAVTFG